MNSADTEPIRLLIVEDHAVVRAGLIALLARYDRIQVVGETGTVAGAIAEATRLQPDLVLMDVRLPDGKGLDACREIRRQIPEIRVLFLTSFTDEEVIMESLDAGADGYLLKEINEEALVRAIHSVAGGHSVLDTAITRRVLERVKNPAGTRDQDKWQSLSPQERRVLASVAEGRTNKEIAQELGLSDKTVKNYLSNVLEKLELSRRSQAAAFYVQQAARGGVLGG